MQVKSLTQIGLQIKKFMSAVPMINQFPFSLSKSEGFFSTLLNARHPEWTDLLAEQIIEKADAIPASVPRQGPTDDFGTGGKDIGDGYDLITSRIRFDFTRPTNQKKLPVTAFINASLVLAKGKVASRRIPTIPQG